MVTNETQPITTNIREMNSLFLLTESRSRSINTCHKKKKKKSVVFLEPSAQGATFAHLRVSSYGWTYSDDLGEEDGEDRLHRSIDHCADCPHKDVWPFGDVQPQHVKERHVGHILVLQTKGTEPGSISF